jgi:hypothetical protein
MAARQAASNPHTEPGQKRAAAATRGASSEAPHVDEERDYRDAVMLGAIKAAIQLIQDSKEQEVGMACNVLRLARDRLSAEVVHGK